MVGGWPRRTIREPCWWSAIGRTERSKMVKAKVPDTTDGFGPLLPRFHPPTALVALEPRIAALEHAPVPIL